MLHFAFMLHIYILWISWLVPPNVYLADDAAEVINIVVRAGKHGHTQHNVTDDRAQVVKEVDRNCITQDASTLYCNSTPHHLKKSKIVFLTVKRKSPVDDI